MNKKELGFTLIELMITVAIAGILASMAAPSFVGLIERTRVKTAAESIYADLQYTKMQSVKQNNTISLIFTKTSNTIWCYGITDKGGCDCTKALADATSCSITENGTAILKVTSSSDLNDMQMVSAADDFPFNPIRSTVSNAEVTVSNGTNTIRILTSGLGRIRYCIPAGDALWGGYSQCL